MVKSRNRRWACQDGRRDVAAVFLEIIGDLTGWKVVATQK